MECSGLVRPGHCVLESHLHLWFVYPVSFSRCANQCWLNKFYVGLVLVMSVWYKQNQVAWFRSCFRSEIETIHIDITFRLLHPSPSNAVDLYTIYLKGVTKRTLQVFQETKFMKFRIPSSCRIPWVVQSHQIWKCRDHLAVMHKGDH